MPLDIAYSIEVEDFIDPDKAYDLYWSGVIRDNKAFVCPGTDCLAQVTCANLYVESQNMKVVPHFRIYGAHSQDCEIFNQKNVSFIQEPLATQQKERNPISSATVDKFILARPESYYDLDTKNKSVNLAEKQKRVRARKVVKSAELRKTGFIGNIYSVRMIVSRYIRYSKDGTIDHRFINIKGKDVSFKGFLKLIAKQKISSLPSYELVYHGWAYIDKYEIGYRVKFINSLKNDNGEDLITSFFIYDDLIEKYEIKNLVISRIRKIVGLPRPKAYVFIYGKPQVVKSKKHGKYYANFKVSNLDYIDVNISAPF
ncbi:hypothetical protein [Pantoea ananatis]|uniref:hypothetical protein n=1 Tax=Pantoea ananas TaxID=553 RepID=UPI001B3030A6|nr:hypothetical protein [Pantoea ananatis]